MLNDDDINPKDIVYNGDLKKKGLEDFARTFNETSERTLSKSRRVWH